MFFVLQYAKYMEKHNPDIVRNIYKRACNIHLPKKATIHLEWAAFEERQGKFGSFFSHLLIGVTHGPRS